MHTDLGWSTNTLRMDDMSSDMGSDIISTNYYLFRFKYFGLNYLAWIIWLELFGLDYLAWIIWLELSGRVKKVQKVKKVKKVKCIKSSSV
jgi:hypothetical protein